MHQHDNHNHSEHQHSNKETTKEIYNLVIGTIFFILGFGIHYSFPKIAFLFFLIAYLILGLEIIISAFKNLIKGEFLDENFLMSLATVAAFCIHEYPEAVGVMLFYRIGEWFEHRAVIKSHTQIKNLLDLRPDMVLLIKDDKTQPLPPSKIVPGNILLVRPGDCIPFDGTILKGTSQINTAPITGESIPQNIKEGDFVFSGCINLSGVLHLKVEKNLEESMMSKILDSVENAASKKPKMDRYITRFSKIYTPFVVLLAFLTATIPPIFWGNFSYWIYTAITFLVISCPCALVLSIPLTFFSGIGAASRKGILFKSGSSLEALTQIKTVVMDKTGTITKGDFNVQNCILFDSEITEEQLFIFAASCEQNSTHPIAIRILEAAKKRGFLPKTVQNVHEIPGQGIIANLDNHLLLCGSQKLMQAYNVEGLSAYTPSAQTEVLIACNKKLLGLLQISDTLKEDAKESISLLKAKNIYTVMLTGDKEEKAKEIANEIRIDKVYSELLPTEKLDYLQQIRSEHGAVMYVGDGINDAPVLAFANIGAAMGTGADAAIELADIVFMNSSVKAIPDSLKIAQVTKKIVMQNILFALSIKLLVILLGLFGFASMWIAVLSDSGVSMLCILNSIRILYTKKH